MQTNFKSYLIGLMLSVILTLGAYFAVVTKHPSALAIIMALAVIQVLVQLIFFLHLKERLNLALFISTAGIVLIVVIGALWIMKHLNYHTVPVNEIMKEEGIYKGTHHE